MRQSRKLKLNASYHVCARINRQELALDAVSNKEMFLDTIKRCKTKYEFQIRNFCIMGNHIHFDITPIGKESLSKIMQWLLSVFAVRYNKKYGIIGHLWYDRFKSRILNGFEDIKVLYRYIADNPVKAKLAAHPQDFIYSGAYHFKSGRFDIIEKPDQGFKEFIIKYLSTWSESEICDFCM